MLETRVAGLLRPLLRLRVVSRLDPRLSSGAIVRPSMGGQGLGLVRSLCLRLLR
jgi:hypothetical protein